MVDQGVTEVGSIVGYLRIDDSDWNATLDRADAKSKQVGRNSPTVKVKTDGVPQAIAALQALKEQEDRVANGADSMSRSVKDANDKGLRPLLSTALLLGPALSPLAVTGAAVLGGLALGAASAALAIKGLQNEAQAGTIIGNNYSVGIKSLQEDLAELERQAASGIVVPFNNAIAQAHALLPTLSGEMREFSGITGDAADHLIHGLVNGFVTLRPLLTDVIVDVDRGAAKFDQWTSNTGGISKFMTEAQYELPIIGHDLAAITVAALKVADAFGSTGIFALNTLGLIARAIDAIPINQLDHVAGAVAIMFAAWKGYQILNLAKDGFDKVSSSLSDAIAYTQRSTLATQANAAAMDLAAARGATFAVASDGVAAALSTQATKAEAAAVATSTAAAATEAAELSASALLGPLGLAAAGIGAVALAFLSSSDGTRQATQDINDYTQALKADNGAIAANVLAQAGKQLVDSGAANDAKKLGLTINTLTSALTGNADAQNQVMAAIARTDAATNKQDSTGKGATKTQIDLQHAADDLSKTMESQTSSFASAQDKVSQLQDTYAALGLSLDGTAIAADTAGQSWAVLNSAQLAAQGTAESNAAQIAQTTLVMQYENNAVGLLSQAFDLLNGKTLDVATAQTQLDSATLQLITSLKTNKGAVDSHTQAGLDDQQAIEGTVRAMQARATAEANATGNTKGATAEYKANAAALLDQIGKLDGTTSAVYRYAQQLLTVPPVIETKVELDADKAAADLAKFQAKLATFTNTQGYSFISNGGSAKPLKEAAGGYITGPGSGTSDSIAAELSNGEFVMPADRTSQYRSALESMRNGTYGVAGPSSSSPAGQYAQATYTTPAAPMGSAVKIDVHPSPGMDEYGLAVLTGRYLSSVQV